MGDSARRTTLLEQAAQRFPKAWRIQSDLASLHLDVAATGDDPFLKFRALEAAASAAALCPLAPEARFNLALSLEKLHLSHGATSAWQAFLALDKTSRWAQEARARLQGLHSPSSHWAKINTELTRAALGQDRATLGTLVRAQPQRARELATEDLLGQWADETTKGNGKAAATALAAARVIGFELDAAGLDQTVLAAVGTIDKAVAAASARELAALEAGHSSYYQGRKAYESYENDQAVRSFSAAAAAFGRTNSPLQLWARMWLAFCQYRNGHYPAALSTAEQLSPKTTQHLRLPALEGRRAWLQGLVLFVTGRWGESLLPYKRALENFHDAMENGNQAILCYLLAENLGSLGLVEEARKKLAEALALSEDIYEPDKRQLLYEGTAYLESLRGSLSTALLFQSEAVSASGELASPVVRAGALSARADIHARSNMLTEAAKDIEAAEVYARSIQPLAARRQIETDLFLRKGSLVSFDEPVRAISMFSSALRENLDSGHHFFLASLYSQRSQAFLRIGQEQEAENDLVAAIQLLLGKLEGTTDQTQRDGLAETLEPLVSDLVYVRALKLDKQVEGLGSVEAGHLVEGSAGRASIDHWLTADARMIRQDLRAPARVAILVYGFTRERLLAWLLQGKRLTFHTLDTHPEEVRSLATELRLAGDDEGLKVASRLYDLLIKPLASDFREDNLVIVPDGPLWAVPFPALYSVLTGSFLLETHRIQVVPSLTWYLESLQDVRERPPAGALRVTALGNASFNRDLFPSLPVLPGAEEEVKEVASHFERPCTLLGREATRRNLVECLRKSSVLHLATHAIPNRRFPSESLLVLAPDDEAGDSGILLAGELPELPLTSVRLAVLSACESGTASREDDGEIGAFVRPLLLSGVDVVVGAQWRVEDRAALMMFRQFYHSLMLGENPLAALRHAQLECLSEAMSSRIACGAFQFYGVPTAGLSKGEGR